VVSLLLGTSLLIAGQAIGGTQAPSPPAPDAAPTVTCETKNPDLKNGTVSFDTKGVEFGPWIRRFVQRVRRNWVVPTEASVLKGCAIISVRVLKNGTVAETTTMNPSEVPAYTEAARNTLIKSSPLEPLPAGYTEESAAMTITFYYSLEPPSSPTLSSEPAVAVSARDFSTQPEPTASPTRVHGHSLTFRLAATGTSDPIDLLRWFATGKGGATGLWLVEHQHDDAPGGVYCRGSLALSRERLVFRSENLSEGFVATAEEITTVNRRQDARTFTISFR
jgi:TonB-like protein